MNSEPRISPGINNFVPEQQYPEHAENQFGRYSQPIDDRDDGDSYKCYHFETRHSKFFIEDFKVSYD